MGIIKKVADSLVEKTVEEVTAVAVIGAIEGAAVVLEKGAEAASLVSDKVSKVVNKRNESLLKKENKALNNCTYITKEPSHGRGIYYAKTADGDIKFSSFLSNEDNEQFELKLRTKTNGNVSSVRKEYSLQKGIFKKTPAFLGYLVNYKGMRLGHINEGKDNKRRVYKTDFNGWVASGDFSKGNYVILDGHSGETLATITKKYKNAKTFSLVYESERNEDLLVLFAILIDLIC